MIKNTIKLLGIDPGINNTGYSVGIFDPKTDVLVIKDYGVICANALTRKERKADYETYRNVASLSVYADEIEKLLVQHKPDYVACESSFYNPRMPNAYLSLSLCIHTIKTVLYEKHRKLLNMIAPSEAKLAVATGLADKTVVQEAIHNRKDLIIKHTKAKPMEKMVEHEADSIAIMYAFAKGGLRNFYMAKDLDQCRPGNCTKTLRVSKAIKPAKSEINTSSEVPPTSTANTDAKK